jgi:hypothetical protein
MTQQAGRPRQWVAGLSLFVALAVGVTLWLVLRDDPYVAPAPPPGATRIEPAAAGELLRNLTSLVDEGDIRAAADLGVDDPARRQLSALVHNARRIGLEDVDLRYVDELGGVDAAGKWSAIATATWRMAGFDQETVSAEIRVDFRSGPDGVGIAGLGGPGAVTPVWLDGPVEVRRTADTLVVAARDAAAYSRLARRAVLVVRRVLPAWAGGLVVEVPRSPSALDAALDVERGTFTNVAGVTAGADGSSGDDAPVHVFLNPAQMEGLRAAGAQVVVSHEAAHVALDAPASDLPVWLAEGFADYVALRDVPLPLTTTAAQIIRQVRREGAPRALPDDADFDEESRYFGASYEASWIACRLLAQRAGEAALVDFYRQADGDADFEAAFRSAFGITEGRFTREWRDTLSDLAG